MRRKPFKAPGPPMTRVAPRRLCRQGRRPGCLQPGPSPARGCPVARRARKGRWRPKRVTAQHGSDHSPMPRRSPRHAPTRGSGRLVPRGWTRSAPAGRAGGGHHPEPHGTAVGAVSPGSGWYSRDREPDWGPVGTHVGPCMLAEGVRAQGPGNARTRGLGHPARGGRASRARRRNISGCEAEREAGPEGLQP